MYHASSSNCRWRCLLSSDNVAFAQLSLFIGCVLWVWGWACMIEGKVALEAVTDQLCELCHTVETETERDRQRGMGGVGSCILRSSQLHRVTPGGKKEGTRLAWACTLAQSLTHTHTESHTHTHTQSHTHARAHTHTHTHRVSLEVLMSHQPHTLMSQERGRETDWLSKRKSEWVVVF